uniref:Putative secreted protein n=1 Tax=Anopheles darlingi TaxID=43151 RepID=A0A2M4D6W0_ANODA
MSLLWRMIISSPPALGAARMQSVVVRSKTEIKITFAMVEALFQSLDASWIFQVGDISTCATMMMIVV